MPLSTPQIKQAACVARGLAIDAIAGCSSGHLGLPLGAAEIGAVLFGQVLRHTPAEPRWIGRDRFVLSAGHGSMFLYAWLHLSGFELSLDDLKAFRRLGSRTPGHPEFRETPGVEITSGPLGQGVGNAVGMAISLKRAAGELPEASRGLLDATVFCLAGDGCMQEGVALEATELAGHLGLDNLVLIWDSNRVTLDAMADVTQSQNVRKRYEACGWHVFDVNGHDPVALGEVLLDVRDERDGMPRLVIAHTEIGRGIPQVAGTPKGHGEGGAKFAAEARRALGLPDELFHVPDSLYDAFATHAAHMTQAHGAWEKDWEACGAPGHLEEWRHGKPARVAELPAVPASDAPLATRKAASQVLQHLATGNPRLFSLNADLYGSNLNYIADGGELGPGRFSGCNLRVGIREHAMGAIMNGIVYEGLYRPLGGTFMVFSDYLRPSIRLAALAGLPVVYWFTHDSVGVGEDGPTHQPVESVSALRLIPGLELFRPADLVECDAALREALKRLDGPVVLSLSRQNLPALVADADCDRFAGVSRGGYVIKREVSELELVLMAAGSEVQHVMEAARILESEGRGVRVVSMVSLERFEQQDAAWRESVLPDGCRRRIAIEAGRGNLWYRHVGLDGRVLAIDRFGISAPGDQVMQALGMEAGRVLDAARELLS